MAFGDIIGSSSGQTTALIDPFSPSSGIVVSVGDLIVVNITIEENGTTFLTSCNDNLGNSFTAIDDVTFSTGTLKAYWSLVTVAGTSTPEVSNVDAAGNDAAIVCVAYEGPFLASPRDKNPAAVTDSISPFSAATTTTLAQANELIVGYFGSSPSINYLLPGPSARLDKQEKVTSGNASCCLTSLVVSATTAQIMTVQGDTNALSGAGVVTFKKSSVSQIGAGFAGGGVLRGDTVQSQAYAISAVFAGAGNLTANTTNAFQVSAQFVGSGNLSSSSHVPGIQLASASFAGAGQLSTAYVTRHLASITFEGAGELSPNTRQRYLVTVRLGGVGEVSARTTLSITDLIASVEWPDTLPQCPVLNGFSEQRQRNLVAFKPDVGPSKIRMRATASGVNASVTFRMTGDELLAFNTFFIDSLEDGSIPFIWRHPTDGLSYSWWFDSQQAPRVDRMTPDTFRVSFNILRFGRGRSI